MEGGFVMWVWEFERAIAKSYDTPDEFIQAVGYFAMGASLANRVWVRSPRHVGTNLYVILTSMPGWLHKSSAILAAVDILKQVIPADEVLPTNPSIEALGRRIPTICKQNVGHGIMLYDELRSFLAHAKKEYASQLGSLVIERFERGLPTTFSKVKEGGTEDYVISGQFVLSFIASTQTNWLLDNVKGEISGGLMSRFLLVESHSQTRVYPLPAPIDDTAMDTLAGDLKAMRDAHQGTEFLFRGDAARVYTSLYKDLKKDAESHGHPEYASLISRSPVYLKKLALIHAVMSGRGSNEIHADDVEAAREIVAHSVNSCRQLVDEAAAQDGMYGKTLMRTRKIVSGAEKISRSDLLRFVHVRPRELDEILESLEQQGLVALEKGGAGKGLTVVWKGISP